MSKENIRWNLYSILILGLLLLAGAEFLLRGPVRFVRSSNFNDFISPYIQTRTWMKGEDPYSPAKIVALWPSDMEQYSFSKKDLADGSLVLKRGIPTAYPPTAFMLLATIAWLPWTLAYRVWLGISILAFGLTVLALLLLLGFQRYEKRTYVFLTLALALAPFHTGLATGSIVIVVVGLCAVAVLAADRRRNIVAGILLAIAAALKPQIGLLFFPYYLLTRRWRVVAAGAILLAIVAAIAVLRLGINHTPWVENYLADNRILFGNGSLGDFTQSNPDRFSLVDLQVLVYTFLPDRAWTNLLSFAIAGGLGFLWLLLLRRCAESKSELLALATLMVLSLLPVYHRFYDASLLIFPLAWSLASVLGPRRHLAKGALLLMLVFLVPGGSALEQLRHTSHLAALQDSWWWTHVVMPHQVWALFFLGVLLLAAMRTGAATTAGQNSGDICSDGTTTVMTSPIGGVL